MTSAEMRKAKAELHKVIVETVFSFNGSTQEDATMFKYIIEIASNELYNCAIENENNA